jgi:ribonuclease T2
MLELSPVVLASLLVALSVNAATSCPPTSSDIVSCSTDANGQDACCVPSPGGTFLFKQRFEPDKGDEGRWGIDGLDVLE